MKANNGTVDNKVKMVFWFIDDQAHQIQVHKPLESCIRRFTESLAKGKSVATTMVESPELKSGASPKLAGAIEWLKVFTLPGGLQLGKNHNRDAEILVYGLRDWEPLMKFLTVGVSDGISGWPFWPHLVITDVFRGELTPISDPKEIIKQAGYKFAKLYCVPLQIPTIVISSEHTAIEECDPEWGGDKDLYSFKREDLTESNKVTRTLEKLSEKLFRRWWIPEFTLALKGNRIPHTDRYLVEFSRDGDPVSVREVSAVPYAFLYLWAYGSLLAQLKRWGDTDLDGWYNSKCIAVSSPPSAKNNGEPIQILPTMKELFEPQYWNGHKNEIFFGSGKNSRARANNVLNANIIHLQVPHAPFPSFWNNEAANANLMTSMREILPIDGLEWLAACCSVK